MGTVGWHDAHQRATSLLDVGRAADALAVLGPALARFPDQAELWVLVAIVHRVLGQDGDARSAGRRALELAPDWPEAQLQAAIGEVRTDKRRATELARNAVAARPADVRTLWLSAEVLRLARARDEAWALVQRALVLAPGDVHVMEVAGLICLDLRRPADAEAWFRAALAERADDAHLLELLAIALERRGDPSAAVDVYVRSVIADPKEDRVAAHLERAVGKVRDRRDRWLTIGFVAALLIAAVLAAADLAWVGIAVDVVAFVAIGIVVRQRRDRDLPVGVGELVRSRRRRLDRAWGPRGEMSIVFGLLAVLIGTSFMASPGPPGGGARPATVVIGAAIIVAGLGAIVAGVAHLRRHPVAPDVRAQRRRALRGPVPVVIGALATGLSLLAMVTAPSERVPPGPAFYLGAGVVLLVGLGLLGFGLCQRRRAD